MGALYVTESGTVIRREGRRILIIREGSTLADCELLHISCVVLFGRSQVTIPALHALLQTGVPLTLLTHRGRLRGRLVPPRTGLLARRLAQYAVFQSAHDRLCAARRIVTKKLNAMRRFVDRTASNYPALPSAETRKELSRCEQQVAETESLESLRGIEGFGTRAYWRFFRAANRSDLTFVKRTARPPRDPVNALLSLGYVLVTQELASALEGHGLETELGFYHEPRSGRPSLALDVLEPFRHDLIDRLVLKTINRKQLQQRDFLHHTKWGTRLTRNGLKKWLALYEQTMLAPTTEIISDEQCPDAESIRTAIWRRCESIALGFSRIGNRRADGEEDAPSNQHDMGNSIP